TVIFLRLVIVTILLNAKHILSHTYLRVLPSFALCPYTTLFRSSASFFSKRTSIVSFVSLTAASALTSFRSVTLSLSSQPCKVFRSEEHTSELQSRFDLVCRLLLEKKNANRSHYGNTLSIRANSH